VFAGLDDLDWAAMSHAYGPATEVPGLLRGLVSDDPAAREVALDGMYGAVHHQGDVYDCTIASIPFLLEAAAKRSLPGRGAVLELLASIGGVGPHEWGETAEAAGVELDEAAAALHAAAGDAVGAACPLYLELLADADPEVRRAAPLALLACWDDARRAFAALRERLAVETDPAARASIVAAAGRLGRRVAAGVDPDAVRAWLAGLVAGPGDPAFRLAATAELVRCGPAALTAGVVPAAAELLRATYAAATRPTPPAGFSTGTLTGAVRELFEREAAGRRSPAASDLVRELSRALGDRVEERLQLLTGLLRASDWEARHDAIRPARTLIEDWRGPYEELVELIGEQLADPRPRLAGVAAHALEYLDALAAPAAGALARALEAAPREGPRAGDGALPPWIIVGQRGLPTVGPTLRALASLGDARALPPVRWALERPDMAADVGLVASRLGPATADLVPLICRRLRDLPVVDGYDRRRQGLVAALGGIGEAAAAAVPELLALAPEPLVLTTLGRIGPGARDALPALRRLLDAGQPAVEIAAAAALWRVEGDPGPILPTLARHLAGYRRGGAAAAEAAGELGPAGAALVPGLRAALGDPGPGVWLRLAAAAALWRVIGDAEAALPALAWAWSENAHARVQVARCIAEMGPAGRATAPLLREELGRRRRHNASDNGWSSDQVRADLALLRACAGALAALGV
jgi:hypothetical protein